MISVPLFFALSHPCFHHHANVAVRVACNHVKCSGTETAANFMSHHLPQDYCFLPLSLSLFRSPNDWVGRQKTRQTYERLTEGPAVTCEQALTHSLSVPLVIRLS